MVAEVNLGDTGKAFLTCQKFSPKAMVNLKVSAVEKQLRYFKERKKKGGLFCFKKG